MNNQLLEQYDAFYNMVLLTTLLSNMTDEQFDRDAKKIIKLIGEAYELSLEDIKECERLICEELVIIPRNKDREKYLDYQESDERDNYLATMLSVKCDVLYAIKELHAHIGESLGGDWFDYSNYHIYNPQLRYSQMRKAAVTGDLIVNKMVGVMRYIGLGCQKDEELAVLSLKQCMLWGDMFSVNILKHIYFKEDKKIYPIYNDLSRLDKYLDNGVTVLPDEVIEKIHPKAKELYAYISSIKQDIILPLNHYRIDFSFVEVLMQRNVPYRRKMYFINNYSNPVAVSEWKEITNASAGKEARIGFKVKERQL